MKKILTALIIISILSLTSCTRQFVEESNIPVPISESPNEIETITEISTLPKLPLFTIITFDDKERPILSIRPPFYTDYNYNELSLPIYHYSRLRVTGEFIKLISEDEYKNWDKIKVYDYSRSHDFDIDIEKIFVNWTDLNEFHNIYSFIYDFNLSEKQIRSALIESNEFGVEEEYSHVKYIYTEEEINALATRNKEEITRLFATPLAIVKGDKIYVPGWFFYSSIEDYKNADITSDDLIAVLDNCRNFQYYGSEIRFGEYTFSHRYLLDLIEYKAYNYLDNNVDVIELCGYERDFSMPMAYDGYYESILNSENGYERYHAFFNTSYEYDTSIYNVIKNENAYSPHWVYYNKPSAYREAVITPDELLEMLPRYEALGILTDEAWAALENKIFDYAESFN